MTIPDKDFEEIVVGESASFDRTITVEDVVAFATLSGDRNPLHVDKSYASQTMFKDIVVHGMFVAALVSRLVGMELPGRRALLLKESLEFRKPSRIGDTLTVKGTVVHVSPASRVVELKIDVTKDGVLVVSGSVHVRVLEQ